MNSSKDCNLVMEGKFCSKCGKPDELKRINKDYILNEIKSVLNFDKGFFYSIRELLIRPGKTIRKFILEDRNRLVKPIVFIIICSLIYTVLQQVFHFEDGYVNYRNSEKNTAAIIMDWVQNNYGYANIFMGIFIAFWTKILFRKYYYNFYEILILLCFVMGMGMLVYSIFGVLEAVTNLKILHIGGIIGFIYIIWAIAQFFDKKKKMNYFKACISYLLGMTTFTVSVIGLGLLIDFLI